MVQKFPSFPPQVFLENAHLPRKHKKTSESKSRSNHQLPVSSNPKFAQAFASAPGELRIRTRGTHTNRD
jgi:hypothetical protein